MDRNPPPRRRSVPPAASGPPAEPELGEALRLLAAAVAILLRRSRRRAAALLHAGYRRARALLWAALGRAKAAVPPLLARGRRLWSRRSVLIAAMRQGAAVLDRSLRQWRSLFPGNLPVPQPAAVVGSLRRWLARGLVLLSAGLGAVSSIHPAVPQRRRRLGRVIRMLVWSGGATLLAIAAFIGYCLYTLPLAQQKPAAATPAALVLEADNGRPFATRGVYRGRWIPADQLPGDFLHAVVAIEDRRFFQHSGIDLWGILRAAVDDLIAGSAQQGGSTITQQLVRMTYLSSQRTLLRKVQEALLAIWLEHRLSKTEILTRYVNTAYYGAGAYGIDAAARRYFDKPPQALDLAESAMLAGLINAPSELAPTSNLKGARERADMVLRAMLAQGYITPAQAAAARAHPATPIVPPATEPGRNYFADAAAAEVKSLIGTPLTNLTVKTTLDPALQDLAERVVGRWLARDGKKRHIGQAALVALAPDGAVLAMVGGRNYEKSQFNRVTQALRQPGSLFKIFVYLAALDAGYTPDSVLVDQPVQIGDWRPKDYERRYRGPVTLKTAFADSINTISAQLVQNIGVERVIAMARRLGVTSPLPAVPSLALGTADVTLMEMAQAMDRIATDTKSVKPYMVEAISARGGTPLYTHAEPKLERPSWHWHEMMDLLQAVVREGTGRAAQLDRPVGGKTGTTNDYRDAWFVGFTSDFVVGVWCGNDDDSPMKGVVGGDVPAKIWHDFVAGAERIRARQGAARIAGVPFAGAAMPGPSAPAPTALGAAPAPATAPASATLPAPPAPAGTIAGIPLIIDTGTLMFRGHIVHLAGVEGETGQAAEEMAQFIAGRTVVCRPTAPSGEAYRCRVGDTDLARAVLYNGGGRATPDAPEDLKIAEEEAKQAGRGIWER
jgi:penicillin-binding protein 1A